MDNNKEYYEYIIKMLKSNDYSYGYKDVNGFLEYLRKKGLDKVYHLDAVCCVYAQMKFQARREYYNINRWARMVKTLGDLEIFKKYVDNQNTQPYDDNIMCSKTDILHGQMKRGEWKPAQRADIPTERLQHLRDEGLSYDKIADAVGMSKSGVAARLKGYKPKNANK